MGNGMQAIQGVHWHSNKLSCALWVTEVPTVESAWGVREAAALHHDNNDNDHELGTVQKITLNAELTEWNNKPRSFKLSAWVMVWRESFRDKPKWISDGADTAKNLNEFLTGRYCQKLTMVIEFTDSPSFLVWKWGHWLGKELFTMDWELLAGLRQNWVLIF